jgi:hypothetical protein
VRDIDFPAVERSYLDAVRAGVIKDGDRACAIVYTPLHGVGDRLVREIARGGRLHERDERAGAGRARRRVPDGGVPQPRGEGRARSVDTRSRDEGRRLILANDPDVDGSPRAARRGRQSYVQLTGNQVGTLLGHYLLTEGPQGGDRLALASIVSSPSSARSRGARRRGTRRRSPASSGSRTARWRSSARPGAVRVRVRRGARLHRRPAGARQGRHRRGARVRGARGGAPQRRARRCSTRSTTSPASYGLFVSGQRSITMPGARTASPRSSA